MSAIGETACAMKALTPMQSNSLLQTLFCDTLRTDSAAWANLKTVMRSTGALLVGELPREFFLQSGRALDIVELVVDKRQLEGVTLWAEALGHTDRKIDLQRAVHTMKVPSGCTAIMIHIVQSQTPFEHVLQLPTTGDMFFCSWDRAVSLYPVSAIEHKTALLNTSTNTQEDRQNRMSLVHDDWHLVNHLNLLYTRSSTHPEFQAGARSANDALCLVMPLSRGPEGENEEEKWNVQSWRLDYCHHRSLKMSFSIRSMELYSEEDSVLHHTRALRARCTSCHIPPKATQRLSPVV